MRVLVVEDEVRLAATLQDLLELNGYTVDVCHDGEAGLDNALTSIYDVILLDVMLPKLDGFTVLRRLRAEGSTTPVLMLTARGELSDRVRGLDQGADYYLTKPFQTPELLACVRLLLRRSNGESGGDDRIHRGDLVLDPGTFQVTCGQRSARLSRKEYDLLEMLMRNGGQILSKEQLLLKAWGYESNAEDNNVEVYISFLRRKLELVRSNMRIRTVRLVGYCLEEKE